jgi:predicted nucleic acid-binding protein
MSGNDALVVDASAAIAILLRDDGSEAVDRVVRGRGSRGVQLIVPELFWVETANTLGRRHSQPLDVILEAIATLDRMGLVTVHTNRAGVLTMTAAMLDHGLSAYDATYLALAETLDAKLLTLDRRLASAAGSRAVDLGRRELRESRPQYRLEPWIRWPGAADYFDAVRRVTLDEARR